MNIVQGSVASEAELRAVAPSDARLEMHYVSFSREELDAVRMKIRADEPTFLGHVGASLQATETDVPDNHIQLYITPLTEATAAKAADLYPPGSSDVHYWVIGGVQYPIYSHVWEMSTKTGYFVNPTP